MKVKTRVIAVLTAVVAVHVVAVPKARCQSTVTTECFRRSVHCRSGWSVAMNNDRSYRRHWFYSIDHSRGQRSIRYRFGSYSCIKKLLSQTETRTRDRMYLGRIRSVRDISREDRARIATCSLRTPTDRLMENYCIDKANMLRQHFHYCSANNYLLLSSVVYVYHVLIRLTTAHWVTKSFKSLHLHKSPHVVLRNASKTFAIGNIESCKNA